MGRDSTTRHPQQPLPLPLISFPPTPIDASLNIHQENPTQILEGFPMDVFDQTMFKIIARIFDYDNCAYATHDLPETILITTLGAISLCITPTLRSCSATPSQRAPQRPIPLHNGRMARKARNWIPLESSPLLFTTDFAIPVAKCTNGTPRYEATGLHYPQDIPFTGWWNA